MVNKNKHHSGIVNYEQLETIANTIKIGVTNGNNHTYTSAKRARARRN